MCPRVCFDDISKIKIEHRSCIKKKKVLKFSSKIEIDGTNVTKNS